MNTQTSTAGPFKRLPFSKHRELVVDIVKLGRRKNHVPVLLEVDVTDARKRLYALKEAPGNSISFTGWVIKCIAESVAKNKQMHALRSGRTSMIVFDEIDVLVTVEKSVGEEQVPLPFIVRKVNEKTISEVNDDINRAKRQSANASTMMLGKNPWYAGLYLSLPSALRGLIGRVIMSNPFTIKRNTGTVGVSSIGMMGDFHGWVIPVGPLPLQFAIGSVTSKLGAVKSGIQLREYVNICFVFDHDIVDGAPVAAFAADLVKLLESAYGLNEDAWEDEHREHRMAPDKSLQ